MADWAELHDDIIASILKKITRIEDFIAFELVCRWWREVARNKHYLLRPQIPRLMLPENKDNIGYRQIYNIVSGETKNLYIPELSDRIICIGLKHGWILAISLEGEMNLVNPISRSRIELPPQTSIEYYKLRKTKARYYFPRFAALSANPSETSDFAVMIVRREGGMYLSYWRPGDKNWRTLKDREPQRNLYIELIYYRDQFYAIEVDGTIWASKVPRDESIPAQTLVSTIDSEFIDLEWSYIVESGGAILVLVDRWEEEIEEVVEEIEPTGEVNYIWTFKFDVYELDLMNGGYKQIWNLGSQAIFVGRNTSISYDVSECPDTIKPNHIYFTEAKSNNIYLTEDRLAWMENGDGDDGHEMGFYNLEDGTCTYIEVADPCSTRINPPFWFIPSF